MQLRPRRENREGYRGEQAERQDARSDANTTRRARLGDPEPGPLRASERRTARQRLDALGVEL